MNFFIIFAQSKTKDMADKKKKTTKKEPFMSPFNDKAGFSNGRSKLGKGGKVKVNTKKN